MVMVRVESAVQTGRNIPGSAMLPVMPRTYKPVIDPDTLTGIQRLIWDHEHATTDRGRVRAARRVSDAFISGGGCGWCWSESHRHGTCNIIAMHMGDDRRPQ